jgi:hypothetical protein
MSFLKKLLKLFNKKQKEEDYSCNDWSTSSINNKEEFFETPLLFIEEEKQSLEVQIFKEVYTKEYKVFISYEEFKDYLINERIINSSLKIYNETKNKRLNGLLSWIEFHVRSTFHGLNKGYQYHYINNTLDLLEGVTERNTNLISFCLNEVNDYCRQFNIKYIWTWSDLEKYNKKFLEY